MFEKDAEELFKKKPLAYKMMPELEIYTDGFNDGYNKCFKQIQKLVNEHTRLDCIIPELLRLKESE